MSCCCCVLVLCGGAPCCLSRSSQLHYLIIYIEKGATVVRAFHALQAGLYFVVHMLPGVVSSQRVYCALLTWPVRSAGTRQSALLADGGVCSQRCLQTSFPLLVVLADDSANRAPHVLSADYSADREI